MAPKKTYYPPKTFDDDLANLAALFQQKGWAFSGVDTAQLGTDAAGQRTERSAHDALEIQWNKLHEAFGIAQAQRYERFAAALNAARGAFRNDKSAQAELAKFKRSVRKAKKPAA
ncbi:MAG: hypothetical protein IT373_02760 [Polyangiaceae bacterium]|nr:hypothetical protein [Polyangiaceae bacterium]